MTWIPNDIHQDQDLYIRELQTYLRTVATRHIEIPLIAVDGIFGPETTQAVIAFQESFGLEPTGRVNRQTWDAIYAEYTRILKVEAPAEALRPFPAPDYVMMPGDTGNLVFFLQIMLDTISERYSNLPPVKKTGIYDEDTQRAVQQMQQLGGLEPNGKTDKATWDKIPRLYNIQGRPEIQS